MKRLCVFCGGNAGRHPAYAAAARELGHSLAARGIGLVYGGGKVGLMGVLADATREAGGEVIGVIPRAIVDRELAHAGLSELRVVDTMHERKQLMHQLSDAFVALPGGFGTLDELFEALTWSQLGLHDKPCAVLNVAGFFDPLLAFLDHAVKEALLKSELRTRLKVAGTVEGLLAALRSPTGPIALHVVTAAEG